MGESFLGVVGNHQALKRLKFEDGIVDLAVHRCVDGAELPYPDIGQLQDLLGLLKIHDCFLEANSLITQIRDLVALMQIKEIGRDGRSKRTSSLATATEPKKRLCSKRPISLTHQRPERSNAGRQL
jgi:hypothetical protein